MKLAVVGTGSIGRRHLENLLSIGDCEIVAVSEHHRRTDIEIAGVLVPTVHNYAEILEMPEVEAVVIANPTSLHFDYAQKAVASGKHVYLEKPAAASSEGLGVLATEARHKGLVIAMGTQFRFNEGLVQLKEFLFRGDAGKIIAVSAYLGEHIADYHPGEDFRRSYTARSDLGGGVLLTQIHQVDFLNWLFGPFESVFAVGGKYSDLDIDVEDCVSYMLRARNGVAVYGHLNYLERPKRVAMRVTGTRGTFDWDYFGASLSFTLAIMGGKPETFRSTFDRNSMFIASMKDFFSAIQSGREPRATLEDGFSAVRIVEAVKLSYETGRSVEIAN
jgi:predicted dehydrogenase